MNQLSSGFLFLAILHTILAGKFEEIARSFPKHSLPSKCAHFLSIVEIIFPLYAVLFLILYFISHNREALSYVSHLSFKEALLVFLIMSVTSTSFIINLAGRSLSFISRQLPLSEKTGTFYSLLIIGPLLGSFISEPAAMTVSAVLLNQTLFKEHMSQSFKYATLALLFVNVSVGGVLTHFAAPAVLMVAPVWKWNSYFMFSHFGWKAIIIVLLNTLFYGMFFKDELKGKLQHAHLNEIKTNGKFLESILVGLFLAGIIILGNAQSWWIGPLLSQLSPGKLFLGSTVLTSFTDNAAITYLGSLGHLSEAGKYALVSGAVTGGGLTVMANAPNPAGYGILRERFPDSIIHPVKLFKWALVPTIIAAFVFFI